MEHLESTAKPDADAMDRRMFQAQLRDQIEACLGEIKPRYARLLRLRLLEDRSREACAALLEVKVATLDVIMYRAVRAFRKAWEHRTKHDAARPCEDAGGKTDLDNTDRDNTDALLAHTQRERSELLKSLLTVSWERLVAFLSRRPHLRSLRL